jgi:hypothetical protein
VLKISLANLVLELDIETFGTPKGEEVQRANPALAVGEDPRPFDTRKVGQEFAALASGKQTVGRPKGAKPGYRISSSNLQKPETFGTPKGAQNFASEIRRGVGE